MEGTVEGFEVRARELLAPFDGVRVDLHVATPLEVCESGTARGWTPRRGPD
jgi:hypothetical protein